GDEFAPVVLDPREHGLRPGCDVEVLTGVGEDLAGEVGNTEPGVSGADVGSEDHAGSGVECKQSRGTASGGDRLVDRADQSTGQKCVHSLRHCRPSQARFGDEFGPGAWSAIAEYLEQCAATSAHAPVG